MLDIDKQRCTGCGACVNICSSEAIIMVEDIYGFDYPVVDLDKCLECGKCVNICPINSNDSGHKTSVCLNMATSYEFQKNSSSGGLFSLMAQKFIENKGNVVGAAWFDNLNVKHIVVSNYLEVYKLKGSKYIQSRISNVFYQVKELLDKKEKVLFSGCPCQIAGLKKYLSDDYANLYTVDLVCHGVPSAKILNRIMKLQGFNTKKIRSIDFRNKERNRWGCSSIVYYKENEESVELNDDLFLNSFLESFLNRESCYNCQFRDNYYSDLTLGDAWHIHPTKLDSKYGISLVMPHTEKGFKLLLDNLSQIEMIGSSDIKDVCKYNISIRNDVIGLNFRNKVLKNIWNDDKKYDVAIVSLWLQNYGTILTNYALYYVVKELGYNPVFLIQNYNLPWHYNSLPMFEYADFVAKNCDISFGDCRSYDDVESIADTFLLASDQVWNKNICYTNEEKQYYYLDFVKKKRKLSYGSSFGAINNMPSGTELDYYVDAIKKFACVSTRDSFAYKILKKIIKNIEYVIDPVFLVKKDVYIDLLKNRKFNNISKPNILAYFIKPDDEKKLMCRKLAKNINCELTIIVDENLGREYKNWDKDDNVLDRMEIEYWLECFYNADYIVTDSYHGTCFSIIFNKYFVTIPSVEKDRFDFFEEFLEIKNRIIKNENDIDFEMIEKILFTKIEWSEVEKKLNNIALGSYKWLEKSLQNGEY